VEVAYKSPGPHPNGLQATAEGLWVMDQGNNRVYLIRYEDGRILREFDTEADKASGITYDGEALWLASTYNRLIIRASATTGKNTFRILHPGCGSHLSHGGRSRGALQSTGQTCTGPSGDPGSGQDRTNGERRSLAGAESWYRSPRPRVARRPSVDGHPARTYPVPHRS